MNLKKPRLRRTKSHCFSDSAAASIATATPVVAITASSTIAAAEVGRIAGAIQS
jgi:hypothetical protein